MNKFLFDLIEQISFYRPTSERYKILYEERAFPSDEYAFQSQLRFHGYKPEEAAVTIKPREVDNIKYNI